MITGEKGEQEKRLRGKRGKREEKERKEGRFRQNLVLKGIFFIVLWHLLGGNNCQFRKQLAYIYVCVYCICEREKKYITIQYNDKTIKRNKHE